MKVTKKVVSPRISKQSTQEMVHNPNSSSNSYRNVETEESGIVLELYIILRHAQTPLLNLPETFQRIDRQQKHLIEVGGKDTTPRRRIRVCLA